MPDNNFGTEANGWNIKAYSTPKFNRHTTSTPLVKTTSVTTTYNRIKRLRTSDTEINPDFNLQREVAHMSNTPAEDAGSITSKWKPDHIDTNSNKIFGKK